MFYNTLTRIWDRATARDGHFLQAEYTRLLGNDIHLKESIDTFISTTFNSQKKELGEIFFLNELKPPSPEFPAICLAQNDATIWKNSNPLGSGNIPGNYSELVDYLRIIPLRFDPLNSNNIDFTITDWSYSGATITIDFSYTTPKGTKESKLIRSLHEDAFVHNANTTIGVDYSSYENVSSWRTITLTEPLRDSLDIIQVPVGTYQITAIAGGESAAAQIKFVHSATPSGTPKSESRLARFYPHRIQDSGQNLDIQSPIKAKHFAIQGRGFVTVENSIDSEWVSNLRRRDRFQGHRTTGLSLTGGSGFATGISSYNAGQQYFEIFSGDYGKPRFHDTTDQRGLGLYAYIWTSQYS